MKQFFFHTLLLIGLAGCQSTENDRSFLVEGVATPEILLNGLWKFTTDPPERFWENEVSADSWADIQVPGEAMMQGFAIRHDEPFVYKKRIDIPLDFREKEVQLQFDGVYSYARVWVNGQLVRDHHGGFTRWTCDITPFVEVGKPAWVTVEVTDRADEISYASGYAKHPIGGILRDVNLLALPETYPEQVNIETDLDDDYENATLTVFGKIRKPGKQAILQLELLDVRGDRVPLEKSSIEINGIDSFHLANFVTRPEKWDAEHPNLYRLRVSFRQDGKPRWSKTYPIGFREVEVSGNKLLVNGNEVKLRGANHHDIHPLLGRVSRPDYEEKDVQLAKEANMNFIRTSHYPPTDNFLRLCDEYGLYVEDETAVCFVGSHRTKEYYPGSSESDPGFTDRYLSQLREMVDNHRNHPAVIIWSIGNENAFGSNFQKSYDWVKQTDGTRPVIFSYPGNVPDSTKSYDILSMHYPGIDGHMDQIGKKTTAFGYADMPVIFDEWAHVACYNNFTVMEDPNIRSFWGQSLDRMWQKVFEADGGLGGAIWGMIDETFMLPDTLPGFNEWWGKIDKNVIPAEYVGHTVGYGEWGIIDTWRRKKPEFWNTKKAYSPVKLLQTVFPDYQAGSPLKIPVYNRFDHTNLSELTVKWQYQGTERILSGTSVEPHERGWISLPLTEWKLDETVNLVFYNARDELIDQYVLRRAEQAAPDQTEEGDLEVRETADQLIAVCANDRRIVFDKKNGLIRAIEVAGVTTNCSGPFLHLRTKGEAVMYSYHEIVNHAVRWQPGTFSFKKEGSKLLLTNQGSYNDTLSIVLETAVLPDGTITIDYHLQQLPDAYIRELGLRFKLGDGLDSLAWRRNAYWSVYPKGHLSTRQDKVALYPASLKVYRQAPDKTWAQDTKSFYYDGTSNEIKGKQLTLIAKATKEHIIAYDLFRGGQKQVGVTSDGNLGCRVAGRDDGLNLFVNNEWDYVDLSWGNYQRNIKLTGPYSGRITLTIH